jgi:hypothetical protein
MAKSTAAADPPFSARQQFYWKSQRFTLASSGRAKGFAMALVDPELPATPPSELSRSFPGFGSILRSSWTDPNASYVAHRTGPNVHHYHDDFNSIVYHAKGVPLCVDFGNCYQPVQRAEPFFHSRVSFHKADAQNAFGSTGEIVAVRDLPATVTYSHGRSRGGGNQQDDRHLLLVKSPEPRGPTYLVVRDRTVDGQPDQPFYWNLWCLADEPQITGNLVHFPGKLGVDLDVHLLAPAQPVLEKDHWAWQQHIYVWGPFTEEQHGIRATKRSSREDFLAVLYPRSPGQAAARTTTLAESAAIRIDYPGGIDHVLLSPGAPREVRDGDVALQGEIAFARRGPDGAITLAVVQGNPAIVTVGPWSVRSTGPVACTVRNNQVNGESSGQAQEAVITLPDGYPNVTFLLDGRPATTQRDARTLTISLPDGEHHWSIQP